jgi:hypothetical protein
LLGGLGTAHYRRCAAADVPVRRTFSESGLKRQDNDLITVESSEAGLGFKRMFDATLCNR